MIKYVFDEKGSLATEEEVITVGFATQEKKGILMKIVNPDKNEYISVELNNNGKIGGNQISNQGKLEKLAQTVKA
jgi:hypothetical protein